MELIVGWLHQGLSLVIPLVILLGLLIFVHEMGHFLVAKYYKVKVEVFSLGFGKKLFSFKRGDTDYCVSLIPLGGYVKMYGDGSEPVPEDQKHLSFTHKPVGQRIAIVLAGPLMNFFFAILLFAAIALLGEKIPKSVVGDIDTNSAAYAAGFRSGDTVVQVDGSPILSWDELKKAIQQKEEKTMKFDVTRHGSGERATLEAKTKLAANDDILSSDLLVGSIEGLSPSVSASTIGVNSPESLAAQSGLKTGDVILSVNAIETHRWIDFEWTMRKLQSEPSLSLKVDRAIEGGKEGESKETEITLKMPAVPADGNILASLGIEKSDLYIGGLEPKAAAEEAGLQVGDKIISIDQQPLAQWQDLVSKVTTFKPGNPPLKLGVLRAGQTQSFEVSPKIATRKSATGHKEDFYALGVKSSMLGTSPEVFEFRVSNPVAALSLGFKNTVDWSIKTALSFIRLIENKVSPSSIGGPIMIGQIASRSFEVGIGQFLKVMAIISINLFVLNLLPIPVLDGGHLVFYSIEALRGAPLSMRKMEIAQQVGLVLLMGLMVFAFFNDLSRVFKF